MIQLMLLHIKDQHAFLVPQKHSGLYSPDQSMTSNNCISSEVLVGEPIKTDSESQKPTSTCTSLFALLTPINNTTIEYHDQPTSPNVTSCTAKACYDSSSHASNDTTQNIFHPSENSIPNKVIPCGQKSSDRQLSQRKKDEQNLPSTKGVPKIQNSQV